MKLLIDENIHRKIINALKANSFSCLVIQDECFGIDDVRILELSTNSKNPLIVITQDTDFGQLVFQKNIKAYSIIYLKFTSKEVDEIILTLLNFLSENEPHFFIGKFVVITTKKKRITKLP